MPSCGPTATKTKVDFDYVDLEGPSDRDFVTQMTTSERALHSRNGWGFAAGGDGDSLPGNFLAVPR